MKKLIFAVAVMLTVGLTSASAQELKLGAHAGIPVGDVSDASDFTLGASLSYLWSPAGIFKVGPKVGYEHFFVKSDYGDDFSFLPIAAEGRVALGDAVFVGLDLGYGIGVSNGNDGGFYYSPKLGFGFMGLKVVGSYSGISMNGGTVSAVTAGLEFGL
ncbi:MAG: hypothetical protein WBL27_06160 [Salinimicrobium sp.]